MNNIKIVMQNGEDAPVYCIISKCEDRTTEMEKVFSIGKGYGFSVECYETKINIVDYFAGEIRASFCILAEEETSEAVSYQVNKYQR